MTYISRSALLQRINHQLAKNGQKLRHHSHSTLRHDPGFVPYFDVARIGGYDGGEAILYAAEGERIRDDNQAMVRLARELGIRGVRVVPGSICENCQTLRATTYEPEWDLSLCKGCFRELWEEERQERQVQPVRKEA